MKNFFNIIFILFFAVSSVFSQQYIHGKISEDTRWNGTIYIDGDLTIPENVRLLIEPGTKIIISANKDFLAKGKDKNKTEIIVKGGFIAKGTALSRIIFTSDSKEPMMADWHGIQIKSKNNTCILDFVNVEYGYYGVNIINSAPLIKNCEIKYNYYAGINIDFKAAPTISGCVITGNDYAGIKCDFGAKPVISECIISQNSHGVISFKKAEPNLGKIEKRGKAIGGNNSIFENWEYNIYNHTTTPIYAQNNNWLTSDKKEIEDKIFDKNDAATSGDVIYMPLFSKTTTTVPVVAKVTPKKIKKQTQLKTDTLKKKVVANNQSKIIAQASNAKKTENKGVVKKENVSNPKNATQPDGKNVVAGTNKKNIEENTTAKEEPKKVVEKELSPEEKINKKILSLEKPALEYQLDNKIIRLHTLPVEYPASYMSSRRTGRVIFNLTINTKGKVESARVLKVSGGEEFKNAAQKVIMQYEYSVGLFKGQPVIYTKNERIDFKI